MTSMPFPPACQAFHEILPAMAAGEACDPATALHEAGCAPCAAALVRERRLVAMLRALPPAPEGSFAPPRLPERARFAAGAAAPADGPRLHLLRRPRPVAVVAAAAALLAAIAVGLTFGGRGDATGTGAGDAGILASAPAVVGDLRIVDDLAYSSGPDDRLLAITGGPEAVAARHSASER